MPFVRGDGAKAWRQNERQLTDLNRLVSVSMIHCVHRRWFHCHRQSNCRSLENQGCTVQCSGFWWRRRHLLAQGTSLAAERVKPKGKTQRLITNKQTQSKVSGRQSWTCCFHNNLSTICQVINPGQWRRVQGSKTRMQFLFSLPLTLFS